MRRPKSWRRSMKPIPAKSSGQPLWSCRRRRRKWKTATVPLQSSRIAPSYLPSLAGKVLILLGCERGDLNPHALRHRILSPARLPFRHSRNSEKHIGKERLFEAAAHQLQCGRAETLAKLCLFSPAACNAANLPAASWSIAASMIPYRR
jgi:hypothetical protein